MQLILASGSPRRSELLAKAGYGFEVIPAEVEEWGPGKFPFRKLCAMNATLKAREIHEKYPEAVVLGADTMVGLDGEVMGKPRDMVEAVCMLERLSGRMHEVCTGVCLCCGEVEHAFFEVTRVQFHDFGEEVIKEYTQRVKVTDKAGGYAIQEHGELLVEKVEGSYENVIGLPIARVFEELERFEVWPGKRD
ncbi:MAG: Maf family protein [Roseibacillus sp.]